MPARQYIAMSMVVLVSQLTRSQVEELPLSNRHSVNIRPFSDLTGEYDRAPVPFDKLVKSLLSRTTLEYVYIDFSNKLLVACANPFYLTDSTQATNAEFTVDGEVERISYAAIREIPGVISRGYSLGFGLLQKPSDDLEMAGVVQYRLTIHKRGEPAPIDSMVTMGISFGKINEVSRARLIGEATCVAGYNFIEQLMTHIVKRYEWRIPKESRALPPGTITRMKQYYLTY